MVTAAGRIKDPALLVLAAGMARSAAIKALGVNSMTPSPSKAICRVCGEMKPHDSFYVSQLRICGSVGECKACSKKRVRLRSQTNPAVQAYDRDRAKLPKRAQQAARISRAWRENNPDGYKAHTAVGNAIRDGRLSKSPCEVCGSVDNLHAHHDDYSKPLDVRWLCAKHHHRMHGEARING